MQSVIKHTLSDTWIHLSFAEKNPINFLISMSVKCKCLYLILLKKHVLFNT